MATTKIIPGVLDLNSATSDKGLKMPSGTELNRPTDATGQIRNNTNETSESSASAMEYYNGTEWKKISNAPLPVIMDFLVVAGGGSGGTGYPAGGGGAGGLRTSYGSTSGGGSSAETSFSAIPSTVYTITVGAGAAAITSSSYPTHTLGNNGSDSVFSTITSIGGGAAGGFQLSAQGGSGGGGGKSGTGGAGTANQGYAGANGISSRGGGGGGAGQAGQDLDGGDGLEVSITGTPTYYAGGAAGINDYNTSARPVGSGGLGGGANGIDSYPAFIGNGNSGTANTGGGGTGRNRAYSSSGQSGGAGGSGIVILRMATSDYSGTTTGSPTVTRDGSDTILTYTGSGTYTA